MKRIFIITILFTFTALFFQQCGNKKTNEENNTKFYSIEDYYEIKKIDAHVHYNSSKTHFIKNSLKDNFTLISINVDYPEFPHIRKQQDYAIRLQQAFPGNFCYITSFKVDKWNKAYWEDSTKIYLSNSFDNGAIGVKVWKNIGMELKNEKGEFVLIDNPRFDPIFDFIHKKGKTLIGHIGEPRNCWLPVEEMTVSGDKKYFSNHPEYHMYLHPEYPSYEELIQSRDNMLEKHDEILFVGAHLGSLEWSVEELAERLDKYPNMAVDMAERISHLQHQAITDWQKVRDFIVKYQDRLIYGTDAIVEESSDPESLKKEYHEIRTRHWKFFTSGDTMEAPKVDSTFKGMKLPKEIINKIYRENAKIWFPGLSQ